MTYEEWFLKQGKLHKTVLKKLENLSNEEIIEYFKFENMLKNEPDFCPLYKESKKCHDMEDLNCYLCACPHFRFNDLGIKKTEDNKILYSVCSINSKKGSHFSTNSAIHQNCSDCLIPHKKKFIKTNFSRDWFFIMREVRV